MKTTLLTLWMIIPFILIGTGCNKDEFLNVTEPTEVVQVFFSNPAYNMDMKETVDLHQNKINSLLDKNLGPGIRVEAKDSLGNEIRLLFRNDSLEGVGKLDGSISYKYAAANRTYAASNIPNVLVAWRGNLEMSEFVYTGPQLILSATGGQTVKLDSLKILCMRRDD